MQRQPRVKDEKHLKFLRSLPCVICGNPIETEAAHIRFACEEAGKRMVGKGEKPDDKWALPLCGKHHREQHKMNERAWWESKGIDPIKLCELYATRER